MKDGTFIVIGGAIAFVVLFIFNQIREAKKRNKENSRLFK